MRADLEQRLRYCRSLLPTLPAVALHIIDLANDPDADLGEVAKVVAMDPALVIKLLRVANSPYYGRRRKSDNLRQAINLLGLQATLTLALSFSLSSPLLGSKRTGLNSNLYWRRSLIAAVACRTLGEQIGLSYLEELFLAGLLQDIGILVFDSVMPTEYSYLLAEVTQRSQLGSVQIDYRQLTEKEREILGADHAEIGAWLIRQWNLPEYLQWAVAGSENPAAIEVPSHFLLMVRCVALSGRVADVWLNPEDEQASVRAVEAAKQWLQLSASHYYAMLEKMVTDLPEMSELFEVRLVDPVQIEGILAEARETLTIRSLQILQEVEEAKRRTELLESRARKLEEQSRLDPLTGLYNRGWLDGALNTEFTRANENGWPLSIAFIDLDGFKEINDRYGHPAGDAVLASVAQLLSSCLRRADIVARYGGDEFLVLLPGVGLELANALLRRILDTVRSTDLALDTEQKLRITVSIGLVSHLDRGYSFATAEALVRAADQMVYAAKRQGRDRIAAYPG
jgi:diguanylate cyclase (GGDEF)-like protein